MPTYKSRVRILFLWIAKHICKSWNICGSWYLHLRILLRHISLHTDPGSMSQRIGLARRCERLNYFTANNLERAQADQQLAQSLVMGETKLPKQQAIWNNCVKKVSLFQSVWYILSMGTSAGQFMVWRPYREIEGIEWCQVLEALVSQSSLRICYI